MEFKCIYTSFFIRFLVISCLACGSCINSIVGDFVFDDSQAIIGNKDVLPTTPILNLFENDFWGTKVTLDESHKSYRPLTVLTFRWNYQLSGGFHPYGFHIANIIIHIVNCILVHPVFMYLLNGNQLYSFLASLLFAVHPIHTEAVCGIVGRADLLCAVFYLISVTAYMKCTESSTSKLFSICWFILSCSSTFMSLFCKEQGITSVGVCVLYEVFYVNNLNIRQIISQLQNRILDRRKGKLFTSLSMPVVRIGCLILWAVALIIFRWYIMNFQNPKFEKVDNPASFDSSIINRVLTYNYLYLLNLWLLLCPEWLCFDWSMGCVPIVKFEDKRIMLVFLFWFGLFMLVKHALFSVNGHLRKELTLSLGLMVIPFLPASNIFFSVGFVLAERVLYIPSLGFCMLIMLGLRELCKKFPLHNNDMMFALCVVLTVYLVRSNERSKEWRTESVLFRSGLKVCPLNAKVHYNVAKSASDLGDQETGVNEYKEAIRLYPEYESAMNNLANILRHKGELDEAEMLLRKVLKLKEDFPPAWMNLGIVLSYKQRYNQSEKCYMNAIKYRRNYPDCYYNLGNLYVDQKRYKLAEKAWLTAVKLKPSLVVAWNNLIILNDNIQNYTNAVTLGLKALEVLPEEASLHFNIANALGKLSRFEEAEEHFIKANEYNPTNALYHTNLGVLYHRWKKYDLAETYYLKALTINKSMKSALQNYELLKKQMIKEDQVLD